MQALILATDEASKLYPLTGRAPAPLLPVLNRPVIAYGLELLVRSGLRDIGIAVYNGAGSIEAYLGAGSRSAAQLTYLLQREPLGSAGSIRWAASGLRETFVVLPGDAIVNVDICAALAFHRARRGIATVIVHAPPAPGEPVSSYPYDAVAVAGGRVIAIPTMGTEPLGAPLGPEGSRTFANTGAYIFEPRIFDYIPPRQVFDCHADLLPELLRVEAVDTYVAEGYWNPIHSVPAYHQAQLDALAFAVGMANNSAGGEWPAPRYLSVQARELAPGILAGRHVSVHPSAQLVAPVYIGAGSQIERNVELGPDVIIGPNTVIDEGATVRNSSILEGTYVGRLVKVDGRVVRCGLVIDAGSGESMRVVDPFLLGEVSPSLIGSLLSRAADCAGTLLLLLLTLPALSLIALALLMTSAVTRSAGHIIEFKPRVRWRRAGGDGGAMADGVSEWQTYGVAYFRTRRADGKPAPLGSFLERTQLYRLPALLSVLKGDLRLVGVRPLDPSEADRLVEEWQRLPYEQPAGFTGLWYVQVNDPDETVATDAYYMATRSLLGDLYLLLYTPVAWAGRRVATRPNSRKRPWLIRRVRTRGQLLSGSLAPMAKDVKD